MTASDRATDLSPQEAARLLRQRLEMGGRELYLDSMTRDEALEQVSRANGKGTQQRPAQSRAETQARGAGSSTRSGATSSSALPVVLPDDYAGLREVALACTRCGLASGRIQVVFSDGPPTARLMVVGEAPGANEDASGVPFVGMAGQFLDLLLATVELSRKESVYIANVLKCRPPGNRDPQPEEIEACSPFLLKQIDLVKPRALLAVGSFSARLLTGRDGMALGKLRGAVHTYHGVPLVVTYHPAALLRNRRWIRSFWDDLQLLRSVIDGDHA